MKNIAIWSIVLFTTHRGSTMKYILPLVVLFLLHSTCRAELITVDLQIVELQPDGWQYVVKEGNTHIFNSDDELGEYLKGLSNPFDSIDMTIESENDVPIDKLNKILALVKANREGITVQKIVLGKKKLAVDLGSGVKMEMTLIPAGEFKMGSSESAEETAAFFNKTYGKDLVKADSFNDEHPQHSVRITKPFYLGTYHVTRGQFRQFVADTGYKTDAEKSEKPGAYGWDPDKKEAGFNEKYSWRNAGFEQTDEHPVVNVSWNDAVAFCKWLSKKEGKTYRLPTEAEWEYACRAGTTTRYYNGDDPETLAEVGNVADVAAKVKFPDWTWTIKANDGYAFTAPVGKFKPNAFGLYDMQGNAWQWCMDWYSREYYAKSTIDDPTGPDSGFERVIRGSSWNGGPGNARSASHYRCTPDDRFNLAGFRVARTL
jgi:formylglycine-generating enzyme